VEQENRPQKPTPALKELMGLDDFSH